MVWTIEVDQAAAKELSKINHQIARRIVKFLRSPVSLLDDPRSIGEALKGAALGGGWKYRVGDYRIISSIQDSVVTILGVRIENRRDVYRKH
ncbi:type II toxin-antitoxin system RelE family toxin [Pseudomonas sp. RT6P73]